MALDYTLTSNNRESRPRSKRLRELGVGGGVGGSNVVTVNTGGANTSEGHSHDNKSALDQITTDKDGYQWLTRDVEILNEETGEVEVKTITEKVKAGYADLAYDLAKDSPIAQKFLSRLEDDTASGLITFLKGLISRELSRFKGGAEFGEFVSGMLTGIGGAIGKKGDAEFESLRVRTVMWVQELIINRLGAQEGDTLFSESDTIETVTDNGDGTLLLKLQSKYDGYFTAMTPGMVIKGIINDLATGGGHYYTSWMRVNSVNASANTIEVSLYPDDEVPAGQNFPPCDLMRIARWGHQTDESKQSIFYISSTEGRIVKLFRVTKPIIDFSNYEITLGTLPEKISEILPIALGESGIYVKNLVVEKIWQLDHQGKLLPTIRDRGPYDPAQMYYSGDTLRPETSDYEQSEVWYLGCKWRCMVTGVTTPPLWNSTSWAMVEGNPNFSIEFEEGNRIWLDPENIHGTLTIRAWLYNQDVTTDIQDSDIEWTRYTEDAAGVPQTASDNIWALSHATVGKQLTITSTDFPANPMSLKRVEFRVKVILRDARHDTTHEDEMIATFIN